MGGKGNAKLITWDFNKEITVTIEDALFSAKSMAIMFGNGKVKTDLTQLKRTISWVATSATDNGKPTKFSGPQGKEYTIPTAKATTYDGTGTSVTSFSAGETYYTTFDMPITDSRVIEISSDSFPGTYMVTGDTYVRRESNGIDELIWNSSLVA